MGFFKITLLKALFLFKSKNSIFYFVNYEINYLMLNFFKFQISIGLKRKT